MQTPETDKLRLLDAVDAQNNFAVRVLLNNPVPRHDSQIATEALKLACERNNIKIVDLLLKESGPQRAKPDSNGSFILIQSVMDGYTDIVKLLLDDKNPHRVKPNARNSISLFYACERNRREIVRLLLNDDSDDRVKPNDANSASLRSAIINGHSEIVKMLLDDKRADPNAGITPMLVFAINSNKPNKKEIIDMLKKDDRIQITEQIRKYDK